MQVFVFLVNRWQCIYNSFCTTKNLIAFMLYDHHILTFQNNLKYSDISYASCLFFTGWWQNANSCIKIFDFKNWFAILIIRISCKIIVRIFEWKSKKPISIRKSWISCCFLVMLLFEMNIYSKKLFLWILALYFQKILYCHL